MARIGFFGGTFDPPHNGHRAVVQEFIEVLDLDSVVVIPAFLSPGKFDRPPEASPEERLQMTILTMEGLPSVVVSDIEIVREGASYTIDTVLEIKKKFPEDQLFWLFGLGIYPEFSTFKEYKRLVDLVPCVFAVDGEREDEGNIQFITYSGEKMSSTQIRNRLYKGKGCTDYLSTPVIDYITSHGLYSLA